jgi:HSP20 family molecular chaperone IbpA
MRNRSLSSVRSPVFRAGKDSRGRSDWLESIRFPRVYLEEVDGAFVVKIHLPGFRYEDVLIHVQDKLLIIAGEKMKTQQNHDKKYLREESNSQIFYRAIPLPVEVLPGQVVTRMQNNVLTIVLPKVGINHGISFIER